MEEDAPEEDEEYEYEDNNFGLSHVLIMRPIVYLARKYKEWKYGEEVI